MKVSEAIDQLKIGDTVWAKGKVEYIDKSEALPLYVEFSETTKYFVEKDEISLTEPSKKVEIPEYVAEWIDFCKEQDFSLHTAMNWFSDLPEEIETFYEEAYSWLTDENYQEHEEIFARAWLDGFTIEPKRWVVKFEQDNEQFYFNSWMHVYSTQPIGYARKEADNVIKFTDKKKAEAVATLVEGSVEEV